MRLDCYAVCMYVICWCYVMICYVLRSWHLPSIVSDPRKLPTEPIPSCRHAVSWPLCVALNLGSILYRIFMNLQQSSSRHCDKAFAGMKADFMSFLLTIDWWCYGSDVLRYNLDTQWPLFICDDDYDDVSGPTDWLTDDHGRQKQQRVLCEPDLIEQLTCFATYIIFPSRYDIALTKTYTFANAIY